MMPLISIQSLSKSYKHHPVLNQIDLQVGNAEIFSLVGVNGAGKTTLLKCLLNFHQPDSGVINISGTPYSEPSARQSLAYLPERFVPPHYLDGDQFIHYMLELHGVIYNEASVNHILNELDLPLDVLKKSVKQYSKGMAQKLGLAALLLLDKELLILDEPMSGLDPKARALVKKQLKLAKEKGKTIFFSSHLLADVEELSDRIGILHDGKIAFCGTPQECKKTYQADTLEDAFLHCIS